MKSLFLLLLFLSLVYAHSNHTINETDFILFQDHFGLENRTFLQSIEISELNGSSKTYPIFILTALNLVNFLIFD